MTDVFSGIFTNTANAIHNRQAAQALAGNDYAGAMSNLARIGNIDGVNRLRTQQRTEQAEAQKAQQEKAARSVAFARQATRAINRTMQEGGDPLATFDQIAPAMQSLGASPEEVNEYRLQLIHNPQGFLQAVGSILDAEERKLQVVNFGSGLGAAVVDERTGQEVNRINPSYRPVGDVLYDPSKGEVVFDARQPTYQTIRNADGSTSVVAIDPNPIAGGAPTQGAPSPAGGADIYAITAQSESGNRDFNADGSLVTSPRGAQGRMQVMPTTQTDPGFGVRPAANNSPEELARVGRDYLDAMRNRYGGDMEKAWAAYNWGPGNLDAAIAARGDNWMSAAPAETRNYVANNIAQLQGRAPSRAAPSRPSAQGGTRVVAQGAPETRGTEYATLTAEEKRAAGLPESGIYQRNNRTGQVTSVASPSAEKFTNDQRSAASFYHRVTQASTELDALRGRGITTPSPQILLGDGTINQALRSQTDRQFMQAARNWLAPILRKDTGAAVTDTELVYYMDIYIPKPGDGPEVLAQKARARATAEQSLRAQAGNAYTEMFGNSPAAPQEGPRLSFQPSQQQLGWVRQNNPSSSAPVGSAQNPRLINPQSPTQSFNNIRSGQYFVAPDGQLRRKP